MSDATAQGEAQGVNCYLGVAAGGCGRRGCGRAHGVGWRYILAKVCDYTEASVNKSVNKQIKLIKKKENGNMD